MNVKFNRPPFTGKEIEYIGQAIENGKISGDGEFSRKCHAWIEQRTGTNKALLTTSGTQALEIAALLSHIEAGDEVIMPSYTFVSTANAFILRGAKIVFVDIRPDTNNIDEKLIENAVTERTKAVVPVHYAGVSCEMDTINDIAKRNNLLVVEDAAQGVMAYYKGRALGSIGDYGCLSFHETKNYSMGEGGAIMINRADMVEEAEIIREKGTDRSRFIRGQVDKYTWQEVGSSFLPSDINAAMLYAQLEEADLINKARHDIWNLYYGGLSELQRAGRIQLPAVPEGCEHNAHMFYIKLKDIKERQIIIDYLKDHGVQTAFHYIPLHSTVPGRRYGRFCGKDIYTTRESERLLRLPLYYGLRREDAEMIIDLITDKLHLNDKISR